MQAFSFYGAHRNSLVVRIVAIALLTSIVVSGVTPTVFARTTYLITDGDQTQTYTTYATNPAYVLDQVGVELGEDDLYTTQAVDGVSEITVQRSQAITVYHCGEKIEVIGYGETVQALLDRLGIPVLEDSVLSAELTEETYDGMEVRVDSVVSMRQTYTAEVPYETVYCNDPTLPAGQEVVLVEGVVGQVRTTADVEYVNKEETSHTVVEEIVVRPVVNQIIAVGTGDKLDEASTAPAIGDGVIVTHDGQVLTYSRTGKFTATAYTHTDAGCNMTTATGTTVRVGTVAVDPTVIPYGTRMFIVTNDGSYVYGIGTAEDCGGAIQGNRLDLYFPTSGECFAFGVKGCTVYFLD